MQQSYFPVKDNSSMKFRDKSFEEIITNSTFNGDKIGFTYQNKDYRSEPITSSVDIFAVYASNIPFEKHLYVLGITENQETVVLYLDGEDVENNILDFRITQNEELKTIYHNIAINDRSNYSLTKFVEDKGTENQNLWYPAGATLAPESDSGRWSYYSTTGEVRYPPNTYLYDGMAYYSNYTSAPIGVHPETGYDYFNNISAHRSYYTEPNNTSDYNYSYTVPAVTYDESEDEYYIDDPDEDGYSPRYHITKIVDPVLYTANQNEPYQADWSFKRADDTYNRVRKKYYMLYGY